MKFCKELSVVSLVVAWSAVAWSQDPVKVDSAHYKVLLENETVRVLKIDYAAGAKSAMHQHPDAIVVSLTASKVRFTMPDGKSEDLELASETALYTPAGTHNPANIGTGPIDAILIEFKSKAPGSAAIPSTRPGMGIKVLAEGAYGVAHRITADPTFEEPAGSKHDYDQVVITLSDTQISLSVDGKPARTTWKRGDVEFIGRGVAHESKNTGGKPVDFVLVAIK